MKRIRKTKIIINKKIITTKKKIKDQYLKEKNNKNQRITINKTAK